MAENLGDATLYLDIDDTPLAEGLANTELLVSQRLQTMADQVLSQNSLITSSFATALGETTTSIETAFTGWTNTFSAQQSALNTQSNQLFTDFTLQLLTQSTTLTESLIAGGAATDAWIRASSSALTGWLASTAAGTATTLTESLIAGGAATDAWIRASSSALTGWLASTAAGTATTLTGLYTNFGNWLSSAFNNVAASTSATANRIVATINGLATRMNQPIAAWNALQFRVPGFHHTVRVPSFTLPTGETVGGQSRSFGWSGVNLQTNNVAAVPHVAPIAMLAAGGLALSPTLAMIAEAGEPEAVIPLSRLPQFAGEAAAAAGGRGRGATELHIHIENAYGIDDLVDQINSAWLDGRLRGLQDQLAGAG